MKRTAWAVVLSGAAWMGLGREAQAQVLITPTGPLAIRTPWMERDLEVLEWTSQTETFYPGRTMGGGNRFHRPIPPPSSFKRRKE